MILFCRFYDIKSFRNDLKEVLKVTGVDGKPTLLFLGESWKSRNIDAQIKSWTPRQVQ